MLQRHRSDGASSLWGGLGSQVTVYSSSSYTQEGPSPGGAQVTETESRSGACTCPGLGASSTGGRSCARTCRRGRPSMRVRSRASALAWVLGLPLLVGTQAALSGRASTRHAEDSVHWQARGVVCGAPGTRRWLVTPDSIGPIALEGLTIEGVRRQCPDARDSVSREVNQNRAVLVLPAFAGKVVFVPAEYRPEWGAVARGRVGSVVVRTMSIRTPEGLGVGSTLAELRARYRRILVVFDEGIGATAVPRAAPGAGIGFVLRGFDVVTQAGGGWVGDTLRLSNRVPDSTRVEAIQVW